LGGEVVDRRRDEDDAVDVGRAAGERMRQAGEEVIVIDDGIAAGVEVLG
jgi:predicted phosphoribosyltransferase